MTSAARSTSPTPAGDPTRAALQALACVLLAVAAWSGSILRGGFAFDDLEAVQGNPVVTGAAPWTAAFRRDYWDHLAPAGHYRPTASLSLRWDHALHGLDAPSGWHLTNVALHVAVVAALALLLATPSSGGPRGRAARGLPWVGLGVFAAHPVLADSVAWISGRSSMLSALPGLLGALAIAWACARPLDRRVATASIGGAAALGLLGALLGKEDGVVFGLLYVVLAARASRRAWLAALVGCGLAAAGYLALRAQALGSPWPSSPAAPLAGAALPARLLVAGRALLEGARLLALPLGHPPRYDGAAFLTAESASSAPAVVLSVLGWLPWLALLLGGSVAVARAPRSQTAWSALLAALSLLPVLQLVPAGTTFAPRFLYLPLLLLAPCLHAAWSLLPRRTATALVVLGGLGAVLGAWTRSSVYADRASFHREVLRHVPTDATAWNELGLAREEAGDLEGARAAFLHAARLDPAYGRPWSNLGRLALAGGDAVSAEEHLRRAVQLGPGNPTALLNLGALLLRQERFDEAEACYRRALALAPGNGAGWRGLARCRLAAGDTPQGVDALRRALAIDPGDRPAAALLDRARGP